MKVSLTDVSKSYGGDLLFSEVSVKIEDTDRIGLVGVNGAGKTTLLKVICGEETADVGEVVRGTDCTIGYQKQNRGFDVNRTVREEMLSVFEDVFAAEKRMRALSRVMADDVDALQEYRRLEDFFLARDGYHADDKTDRVLTGMGFRKERFGQPVADLSGGERTRLAVAKLLLEEPDLLILDEPANHLDFQTLAWLEEYLAGYRGALLLVSHDRYFLDRICTRIWELDNRRITPYRGNYSRYAEQRKAALSRAEKVFEARESERARLSGYVNRNLARASSSGTARARRNRLNRMETPERPRTSRRSPVIRFEAGREPVRDVLEVRHLTLTAGTGSSERILLSDGSFHVERGDKIALIGKNGAGKTTLLRALLQPDPDGRTVKWGGGTRVSYYEQGSDHLDPGKTVLETLWEEYPRLTETALRNALGAAGLTGDDAFLTVSRLSGGQRARLKLTKICLTDSNVLLLDEPTNHLDLASKEVLQEALEAYAGTLILVSHDRYLLDRVPGRIFSLENGKLLQVRGTYQDYLRVSSSLSGPETAASAEKTETDEARSFRHGKERRQRLARLRREVSEAEAAIQALDGELSSIERELGGEGIQEDYPELEKLCERADAVRTEQRAMMERWLSLSEELAATE